MVVSLNNHIISKIAVFIKEKYSAESVSEYKRELRNEPLSSK